MCRGNSVAGAVQVVKVMRGLVSGRIVTVVWGLVSGRVVTAGRQTDSFEEYAIE